MVRFSAAGIVFIFVFIIVDTSLANQNLIGYDENTEIIVSGTILTPLESEFRGLRCFTMESRARIFHVVTAPMWFLKKTHMKFHQGMDIRVVGSKFYGSDGALYLMAKSIKVLPGGRSIQFRDTKCNPVWNTKGAKRSSCMKIFFTPGHAI